MSSEIADRLSQRSHQAGLQISPQLADKLVVYFDLLDRWNRTINLTALTDPDEAIDRLLLEPVAAAPAFPRSPRLIDLGSGGGSPAIPLALALDAKALVMVESRVRKGAFLREVARELALPAVVESARFEELGASYQGVHDVVSIRAVKLDVSTLTTAANFLGIGGLLGLFRTTHAPALTDVPDTLISIKTAPLIRQAELQLLRRV